MRSVVPALYLSDCTSDPGLLLRTLGQWLMVTMLPPPAPRTPAGEEFQVQFLPLLQVKK